MRQKVYIYLVFFILVLGCLSIYFGFLPKEYVKKNKAGIINLDEWNKTIAYSINQTNIIANIDSRQLKSSTSGIFMSDTLTLMIPVEKVRDAFDCAVNIYNGDSILIEKGSNSIRLSEDQDTCEVNGENRKLDTMVYVDKENIYVPTDILCDVFQYQYNFNITLNQANYISKNSDERVIPYKYNYETAGRIPPVRNQGNLGTCWAFASLTALESTLMPKEYLEFSIDHMSMNNSFNLRQMEGGDYTMAMAYLLSWQGPVLERDDPYGDGKTTDGLTAYKHVQEVQIIESKDYETIKKMIFKYGGVQSSFYASVLSGNTGSSKYYNAKTNSYCYKGDAKPNHDIVIIGWDDSYPKENFNMDIEGDGAFICRNSWGDDFGEMGDFYISYYDTNIGVHNTVYTKVENPDNYDNIYQSDLCGYVGQLGYNSSEAYFANAYTSNTSEKLMAVGFYATGIDTEYSIYVCENFKDVNSLSKRSEPIMTGKLHNSGYYTINLDNPVQVNSGQKFAVIVRIKTPGTERPVAVEYVNDEQTKNVRIDDGEGYVSLKGITWDHTEETNNCNVCLKVYTDKDTTGK